MSWIRINLFNEELIHNQLPKKTRKMKNLKLQSTTTETRPSNSQMLNNSSYANTQVNKSSLSNQYLTHNIQQCENRQSEFLHLKNRQLRERLAKMTDYIRQLEQNKVKILGINAKYVKVVNQYYRDTPSQGQNVAAQNISVEPSTQKPSHKAKHQTKVLSELEKEHRNLVKHCLVMEEEIKNYTEQMNGYNQLKEQLRTANHTNVIQLINELMDLSTQNKHIRKQNNRLTYQLEKSKLQNTNLKKQRQVQSLQQESSGSEIQKMRSLVNTVKQQSKDRSDAYESKIYELEIKVQKLENQLRKDQQWVWRNNQVRKQLQIQQVQHIHQRRKLKKDLSDILQPKRRPFLSTEKTHSVNLFHKSKDVGQRRSLLGRSDIFS